MSEVEKMYENAGIKPTYTDECQMADSYYSMEKDLNEIGILFDDYMKQSCPNKNEVCYETCPYAYNKEFYPPFTPEKQIELIKFITSLGVCEIENWNDKGFHFAIKRERIYPIMFLSLSNINLQETLADVINNLWQDLTPEGKQQIKEILE